jgi:hypothetical protein
MINRRKAISQVLALLTVENGVMLAASPSPPMACRWSSNSAFSSM